MAISLAKDDMLRLDALEQYGVLRDVPDAALESITRLAADLCGTPMAALSLIGADAVYFAARIGPGPARQPRGTVPCERASLGDDVYEIPDARYHEDYRPDGIMISGRAFRFYAGVPLRTPAGVTIGCLFVQDSVPHTLTVKQRNGLVVLAQQVITRLELTSRTEVMDRDHRMRQRVETALTVERNFVSTVLDTVGALVAVFDTAGRIVRLNRTCETVSGYNSAALVGGYVWDSLIPDEDVEEAIINFERLREDQQPANFENRWRRKDGSVRRIAWSAKVLSDGQGQTNFIIATGIDVTLQREAEKTLRESEARYRQLVEGSLGMVITHDLSGGFLSVNKHGAEGLGRTVQEMTGEDMRSFIPKDHGGAFEAYLEEVTRTGEANGRLHIYAKAGDIRIIAFRNKLIGMADREPYVLGFGVDISEQVRAEEKLQALIHQSNSVLESVGDGIYGVDLDGRVTVLNPAASQMLGFKPHELLGRKLHGIIHHTRADGSPYPELECLISQTIANLDTVRVSNEIFWRKDGTSFPVEYVARPQIDSDAVQAPGGKPKAIGVVVAFTDTTERRALDRMKDEFISTVSHELRTPLTSLRAALGLVTGGALATRPEKMQQMMEIAIGNTDRLIRLVNDILDIERISSGNAELHSVMCSAADLLKRAAELQQAAALKTQLRFRVDAENVMVWGDPDRLLQAISNLISNAIKFSPVDGEIRLLARALDADDAIFEVQDDGRGIPADKLEHIFERFQQVDASDSRVMGGTGLGLAICRSIITQHGGRIWVTSTEGEGATFLFTVPLRASRHLR